MSDAAIINYVDPDQLKLDVAINQADLQGEMLRHAGLYTHYAVQAARAQRQYDSWKNLVEIIRSKLDVEHRKNMAGEGQKVTEGMVTAAVNGDARMRAVMNKMLDAKLIRDMAESAVYAFVQRKDTLLQLARDAAGERAGELRVSARMEAGETARAKLLSMLPKEGEAA